MMAEFWNNEFVYASIVDLSDFGFDRSPFWCIVFENGKF
jgi:hypothetical protein